MKNAKPEPVVVTTICSLCDEPWEAHGDAPTTLDCIRLLKAKAAQRTTIIQRDRWIPQPYPYPVYPNVPRWDYPYSGTICASGTSTTISGSLTTTNNTTTVVAFKRHDEPPDALPVAV